MEKLLVYYNGYDHNFHYATLVNYDSNIYFELSKEAIASAINLSPIKIKKTPQLLHSFPIYQDQLPGFIADSLPDGWGRLLMDRFFLKEFGIPAHQITPLQRLSLLGRNAVGALSFYPENNLLTSNIFISDLAELSQSIKDVIVDNETTALKQLLMAGGSPQGARPKALIKYNEKTKQISTDPTLNWEDWLIKFPAEHEHLEVCAIEYIYSQLAAKAGLEVPATKFFAIDSNVAAFGIKRFDRQGPLRVPVLSLAGALDLDYRLPNFDYRDLLRFTRRLTNSINEVYKAFARCVFNIIFNNKDDHTKNFAFILNPNDVWQCSAAYDLTFCCGLNGRHQMSVMGEERNISRECINRLIADSNLNIAKCDRIIARVIEVALEFKSLASNFGYTRKNTIRDINQAILENIKLFQD